MLSLPVFQVFGSAQGKLVSDDYGDKLDVDYLAAFMPRIRYEGLEIDFLRLGQPVAADQ